MDGHVATTLTFVRTEEGVARVEPDGPVPGNALPDDLDRLVKAGAVVEAPAAAPKPDVTPSGKGNRGSSGQQGSGTS